MTDAQKPNADAVALTEGLGPCPCCGSAAEFRSAYGEDQGAYFVQCTNALCGLTTNLMFSCMDDPKPILAERWNRRAPSAADARWEKALRQTWHLIDPLHPAGQPGSYARGFDSGVATALETLRSNLGPNEQR